jgi:Ca-activated chloride channel family protein
VSFANTQYLTIALVAIVLIAIILKRLNSSFFKWVKTYWFYERTWINRFSSFCYLLSIFLLMASLLDLRGPEKKVKASLPDQRTIIMIDTSSSMLAEDVRPSRFVKALQMARHFVKSAAGHQVSVVLFSDIQKRLIPFTDDIDLIDSRLAALEKTNSVAGGSNISQAMEEAIQYFEFDSSDDDKSKSGNMLVFTDAEESEGEFKVNVPKNVNLAIVGLGTLKGANIPLRWEDGGFRGYKTFKGQPVVTKLNEEYIKKIGKNVSSFRYWIANSYSIPTEDIMNFFRSTYAKSQSKGDLRVRPVYSHYILIPAIILYCLSVLLGRFPVFKTAKSLVLIFTVLFGIHSTGSFAQDEKPEPKEKALSPEMKKDLELIKEGKADRKYVLKVAEKMLKEKDEKRATELYSEYSKKNDDEEIRFNYATSLLKSNRLAEALPLVQDLMKNSKNEELKNKLRNNLLISTDPDKQKEQDKKNQKDQKDQQDKQNQENKDNKDNKNNKDQQNQKQQDNKKDGGKNNKDDKDKNNKPQGKQDNTQKKPDNNGKPDDKKDEKKEEKKKDKQNGKDKDKNEEDKEDQKPQGPQTLEEKEKNIEQKRRMTKTPAMIKQILSDDRELQKKMMDTSTNERGEMKPKRDW